MTESKVRVHGVLSSDYVECRPPSGTDNIYRHETICRYNILSLSDDTGFKDIN